MVKRAPARKSPRKAKPSTKGLAPAECRLTEPSEAVAEVTEAIEKAGGCALPKLTEAEQDLISHMQDGYQLETDSLGGNPVLRRFQDEEVLRPATANRNTVNALEERGLISSDEGRDPLSLIWLMKSRANKSSHSHL